MVQIVQSTYRPRPVRTLEQWETGGWRVKVHGIAAEGERPSELLVAAAKRVAEQHLPAPASADGRYGVAFLTVHAGREGCWILVDWWANGNQLYHLLFRTDLHDPSEVHPVTDGLTACTWELAVTEFERQAWLECVFAAEHPDLDRYLAAVVNADV